VVVVNGRARIGAVAVLILLAGCSFSSTPDARPSTPPASVGFGDRDPVPVTPSGAVTREITASYDFVTPSKNIGCFVSADSARCDIADKSWTAPPQPADCDLAWGNGVSVGVAGEASMVCAGDTVLGGARTLPYGDAVRVGDFVCVSAESGVRCTNEPTGHGFTLSRQSYDLF
jgi:hypothetical protein